MKRTAIRKGAAEQCLSEFERKWDKDYASIGLIWRRNWARVIPFFDYPPEIRKVIYTTNAIESINMSLRKVIKTRASFPTDDAVNKLFYLALNNMGYSYKHQIATVLTVPNCNIASAVGRRLDWHQCRRPTN